MRESRMSTRRFADDLPDPIEEQQPATRIFDDIPQEAIESASAVNETLEEMAEVKTPTPPKPIAPPRQPRGETRHQAKGDCIQQRINQQRQARVIVEATQA